MALISNVEVFFVKCDPNRPNAKFNKKNPTWEVQIRTTDKEVKKAWEAMKLGVKAVVPDEGVPYFRVNLRKKSIKADSEPAGPVEVVNGDMKPIDPNSVGNGSVANIRIFQYEYPKDTGGTGTASVLMGIQVVKHIVYTPKTRDDDFQQHDTETIHPDDNDDAPDVGAPSTPSMSAKY
jgi:hypothetical protein